MIVQSEDAYVLIAIRIIYCYAIYHLAMIRLKVHAIIIRKHIVDVYYTLPNNFAFDISRRRN